MTNKLVVPTFEGNGNLMLGVVIFLFRQFSPIELLVFALGSDPRVMEIEMIKLVKCSINYPLKCTIEIIVSNKKIFIPY